VAVGALSALDHRHVAFDILGGLRPDAGPNVHDGAYGVVGRLGVLALLAFQPLRIWWAVDAAHPHREEQHPTGRARGQ
jgi:hypothetical protein